MLYPLKRAVACALVAVLLAPSPALAASLERPVEPVETPALPVVPVLPGALAAPAPLAVSPALQVETISPAASAQAAAPARPAASAQAAQASVAAAQAAQPKAAGETATAALDSVYTGARAARPGADPVFASAPELQTQTFDVSSYRSLQDRLAASFKRLAPDAHRPAALGRRARAAAELEIRPADDGSLSIRATPGATFLAKSAEARLPGIAPEVVRDPQFRALVESLYARLPQAVRARGVRVSVHQMRVEDGAVTEGPHQDPHADYLAVWAVGRRNARGGESVLSKASGETLFRGALGSGEMLLFDNRALFHDATPIARRLPGLAARRDALVFAFAALPPAAATLSEPERAAGRVTIARELAKPMPDASALRPLYESGDPRLQRGLYRAFKRWSRYFSRGEAPDELWRLVKGAAAPWAGHVYVRKLVSVLEFLNQAQGKPVDAEKLAKAIHAADHAFSKAFVEAAEQKAPQGLDLEEAADAISDSVIFPAIVEPFMERRQKGPFDRKAVLGDVARRLKDTVYLYSPMSLDDITSILNRPEMLERLDAIMDLLEDQMEDPRGPTSKSAPALKIGAGAPRKAARRLSSGGAALAIAFIAAGAALHALTGWDAGGLGVAGMGLLVGAVQPRRQEPQTMPAGDDDAPPNKRKGGDGPSPYLVDLTQMARRGEIPPIYLRDDETAKTVQILNQKSYNNVVLIGEPGVGKTAIAEGLALRIAAGKTGTPLDGQRVLLLDIGRFMASAAGSPDAFAAAVEDIIAEAADGNTVLVIDEAHQLARDPDMPVMNTGSFFDQIKRVMTQGRLKLILATTRDEYNRFFARDRALESRSQVVYVDPVPEGPAMELVYRIRGQFEEGVSVGFGAAKAAVELTVRAFRFDALLRMAIKAVDTAATRLRIRPALVKTRLLDARKDLLYHLELLRQARAQGDLERQENLVPQLDALVERYAELEAESLRPARTEVGREDVADALRELGAPVHSLQAGTQEYIDGIETLLRKNLIGHDKLIDQTVEALKRRFAQPNLRKPIFSALLLGPTGTGKTEFARLLARALFGIEDVEKGVIKIDGGAHQHKHDISRIQGSPPGYVGFNATETLMDQVRRKPESIILIDEVEKMHPDILNLFLSILEDGTAKDALGRPVDFSHTVIVFTSNFGVPSGDYEKLSPQDFAAHVREQLKQPFPLSPFKPEMLNRPSLVDVFTPLQPEEVKAIVELRLSGVEESWKKVHGVELSFPEREKTVAALLEEGYDPRNGARPVNRAVDRRLEGPLSDLLISGKVKRGDRVIFRGDWTREIVEAPSDRRTPLIAGARPEARALAERLEALLASSGAPLTMDGVDRALDAAVPSVDAVAGRQDAPMTAQPAQFTLTDHRPSLSDAKLKDALDALRGAVKRPGFDAEPLLRSVKALAQKAKRLGLEAQTRAAEGPAWTRGFEELEREASDLVGPAKTAAQAKLQSIVEAAGREQSVALTWQARPESVVVALKTTSRLTYEEEDKLLAVLAGAPSGPARLEQARDGALEEARKLAAAAKARLGYARAEDGATLWLEWPLPEAAAPKPLDEKKPAPAPEKSRLPTEIVEILEKPKETEAPPAPAPIARPEPPSGARDRSLDGERAALAKRAAQLLDSNLTDRELRAAADEVGRSLAARPELGSPVLQETLLNGLEAFVKYVQGLRESNHSMEEIALDKTGDAVRPAARFRSFFVLYRALMESRPDLAPDDLRSKLGATLKMGRTDNRYYDYFNADTHAAVDWAWKEAVETAFALKASHPALVSEDWLTGVLKSDNRWPAYSLERQTARLLSPSATDADVKEALAAIETRAAESPKEFPASVETGLIRVLETFAARSSRQPASTPGEREEGALRVLLALVQGHPDQAAPPVAEALARWLMLDEKAGAGRAWLVARSLDLGLALERFKLGTSPWKQMAAKLRGDPRWSQLELLRHASVLRQGSSSAEAVVEAANALAEALETRPADATPELEASLWAGVSDYVQALDKERRQELTDSQVTLAGGRWLPVRQERELFRLYRLLIEKRPDLAPAASARRLAEQLKLRRVMSWRRSSYEGLYTVDKRAGEAAQWTYKQLVDLASLVHEKRPDLVGLADALAFGDRAAERVAETHHVHAWGIAAWVAGGVLTAAWLIAVYNDAHLPHWTLALPVALPVLRVAFIAWRRARGTKLYRSLAARLRREFAARAATLEPIDALRLVASFDQETGLWSPQTGRSSIFKTLARRPEFAAAARGEGLGRAEAGDEERLVELSQILADQQTLADTARDAAQRLRAALRDHPANATPALEESVRGGVDSLIKRVADGSESFAYDGDRPAPRLRSRGEVDAYVELLTARPDLAGTGTRAVLSAAMALRSNKESRAAIGWIQARAAALAAVLEKTRPDLLTAQDQLSFYTDSLRARVDKLDGVRSSDSALGAMISAIVGAVVAGGLGALARWVLSHGWLWWASAAIGGAAGLVALARLAGWLVQRARAKRALSALDRRLEDTLVSAVRRGTPRAALDLAGEYDAERESWYAKPGMKAVFDRLAREWPEFAQVARGKK